MSLLTIEDLGVRFHVEGEDVEAVRSASLHIERGETVALVGESGSGKSVTALSVLQLLPYPRASHPHGSVRFDGEELLGAESAQLQALRGNRVAMVFQEPMTSLNPLHSIEKQLCETLISASGPEPRGSARPGYGAFRVGRPPRCRGALRRLAAPAFGRSAPAGDDRHGPGQRARPAHRRRTDYGARCDYTSADSRPAQGLAGPVGHGDSANHPRSGHRPPYGRSRLCDERRRDRRTQYHRGSLHRSATSLYPHASSLRARGRTGSDRRDRARSHPHSQPQGPLSHQARSAAPHRGPCKSSRWNFAQDPRRADCRHRRRIRFGQDDAGAGALASGGQRRPHRIRQPRHRGLAAKADSPAAPTDADRLPGSLRFAKSPPLGFSDYRGGSADSRNRRRLPPAPAASSRGHGRSQAWTR